jgi:DNA-binding CsgD family transcriptional regulator
VNALSVLGRAAIADHDRAAVDAVVERMVTIASVSGNRRAAGAAALLEGEAALDAGDREAAAAAFERALDHYAGLDGLLDVAHAHLGLAEAAKIERPAVARVEASVALAGFDSAGASRMADLARALLRELGDRSHVGRKGTGLLTDRELEILRLVARGLTNAEIADRLFISVKTAGNHVSNILPKIGARSRTEAAAFAALHPEVLAVAD